MFAPCVTIKAYFPATESRDTWLVLLLRVEDFSEMKASQRDRWQAGDGCPGETPKEVGVHKATIDDRLEKQRARLTTQLEAPPLWNP
jgi:hypothetical protein